MANINTPQKILLYLLYALVILMLFFSFKARENFGQQGFESCIQKKCEVRGEEFCSKVREKYNCCMGAGGQLGVSEGKSVCVFKDGSLIILE